jgi:hypothetical protein
MAVAAIVVAALLASRYQYGPARQQPRPSGIGSAIPASLASPMSLSAVRLGGVHRLALAGVDE